MSLHVKLQFVVTAGTPSPCKSEVELGCSDCSRTPPRMWSRTSIEKKLSSDYRLQSDSPPPMWRVQLQILSQDFPLTFNHLHRNGLPLRESPINYRSCERGTTAAWKYRIRVTFESTRLHLHRKIQIFSCLFFATTLRTHQIYFPEIEEYSYILPRLMKVGI